MFLFPLFMPSECQILNNLSPYNMSKNLLKICVLLVQIFFKTMLLSYSQHVPVEQHLPIRVFFLYKEIVPYLRTYRKTNTKYEFRIFFFKFLMKFSYLLASGKHFSLFQCAFELLLYFPFYVITLTKRVKFLYLLDSNICNSKV